MASFIYPRTTLLSTSVRKRHHQYLAVSSSTAMAFIPCNSGLSRFALGKTRPRARPLVCSASAPSPPPEQDSIPQLPADTTGRSPPGQSANFGFVGAPRIGISFTCNVNGCGTRISKMIRRSSYEKGTVLIMCPTCKTKHIIADHLGWYSDPAQELTNIEKIAASKGEKVVRVSSNVFDLEKLVSNKPTAAEENTDEKDGAQ